MRYAASPGAGSSLEDSKPSQTGRRGARTAASLATQVLESIQGAPVGPASTSLRRPLAESLMRGQASPVITVHAAGKSHLTSARGAAASALHGSTVRPAARAAAASAPAPLASSNSRQLIGLPASSRNAAGPVQVDGQRNGTRLSDDNGFPPGPTHRVQYPLPPGGSCRVSRYFDGGGGCYRPRHRPNQKNVKSPAL